MAKKTITKNVAARKKTPAKKKVASRTLPSKKKAFAKKRLAVTNGKFLISTRDIIKVLDLNVRTAQRLLQRTRAALEKEKSDYVTVKEFCEVNKLDEGEFQQRLVN